MDISKLTEKQIDIALKIAEEAKRQGVNPEFVLPLAMQESGFKQDVKSKRGAIGVMQLMPNTAKELGVDPYDEDENIKGGVSYIKKLSKHENVKGDPTNLLIAYNHGASGKYFDKKDINDLPSETSNYLLSINDLSGGNFASPLIDIDQKKPAESKETQSVQPNISAPPDASIEEESPKDSEVPPAMGTGKEIPAQSSSPEQTKVGKRQASDIVPFGAGAYLGAKATGAMEAARNAPGVVRQLLGAVDPNAQLSRFGLQRYLNSQLPSNIRLAVGNLERLVQSPVRTMSEVQDALKTIKGVPEQQITKPVYKPAGPGRVALEETGRVIPRTIPGRAAISLDAFRMGSGLLSNFARQGMMVGAGLRSVAPSAARVGVGALGGGLAALTAKDSWDTYQEEGGGLHVPSGRNLSQMSSAVGGGLSMIPSGYTQALGAAMQVPEILYSGKEYYDKLSNEEKKALAEQSRKAMANVDMMGNPLPYHGGD